VKQISFQKEFIPLIEKGKKTVTRRIKFTGNPGDIFYFKASRLGKKEGYIKILRIDKQLLRNGILEHSTMAGDMEEIRKEGIHSTTPLTDIKILWNKINKKGYKWEDNPKVYRIEFEYLEGHNETK